MCVCVCSLRAFLHFNHMLKRLPMVFSSVMKAFSMHFQWNCIYYNYTLIRMRINNAKGMLHSVYTVYTYHRYICRSEHTLCIHKIDVSKYIHIVYIMYMRTDLQTEYTYTLHSSFLIDYNVVMAYGFFVLIRLS